MKTRRFVPTLFIAASLMLLVGVPEMLAQDAGDPSAVRSAEKEYSPYLNHNYPEGERR